jgi:hypothetical protein
VTGPRARRALIASICLAAQAFALAHLFLVVHTRCDEHGEVVHGDHYDGGDDAQLAFGVGTGEGEHEHEHCQTFAEPRELRAERACVVAVTAQTELAQPTELAAPVSTRPLYRLAPKVSPPHAA